MADDKTLDIVIRTKAELGGAMALRDTLEASIGKAKAMGNLEEVKKLTAQLDTVNDSIKKAADSNTELSEAEKEGSKATEFLHHNHRQLHQLFEMTPGIAGTAGSSLVNLFHGPVGPALALGLVVAKIAEQFSEWQKNLDEVGEAAAHSQFGESIKKIGDDMETARSKTEAYALTLADIAKNETTIAQALASQLQLMHAVAAARAAEAKAAEERDKAALARKAAAGEVTPEQQVIAETSNAVKAAKAEAARKKKEQDDEVAAKQAALDRASLQQPALNAAKTAADAAVIAAQKHRDRMKDFGPEGKVDFNTEDPNRFFQNFRGPETVKTEKLPIEDAIKKAAKLVEEYEEKLDGLRAKQAGLQTAADKSIVQVDIDKYETANDKMKAQLNSFRRLKKQYEETHSPEANQALQDKQHAADRATTAGEDNAKEVDKLRRELDDARQTATATQPHIDQELADRLAAILEQAVTKLYSQPRGAEVEAGVKIADQVEGGRQVGPAQAQFITALDASLGGHAKTLKEAARHIEKYKDNASEFFNAVTTLTTNGFTKQQKSLDQLFTIVNNL